ncbi:hypothetical protein EVAR_48740_1 [Eumeta japonica]|uniref:Peptidase A2 domain-containing protein n=1 Tax=Eumeta variegata TaxID=151549 RepID=A0A4C1YJ39_EUMVA|nr:hypothetical protein EVAR_48740_1 [Eumeta japonica]
MIPVVIRGATATLSTFALLDEGSTVTLMEAAVAERVGATGPKEPFTIEGVAGARINANESRKISITIRGLHQKAEHPLVAHTVRDLRIAPQSIPDNIVEECEHLADIRSQITYASGTPTILLGQDNWHLIVTRGVRSGGLQQPAARSPNWAGCCTARARGRARVNLVQSREVEQEDSIEKLIKEHFALDNIGITPRRPKTDPEKRALDILNKESRRMTDGRFQTGLIWRKDDVAIPNNRNTALSRLHNSKKRLKHDEKLKNETGRQRVLNRTSIPAGDIRKAISNTENHLSCLQLVRATGRVQFIDLCRRRESIYAAKHKQNRKRRKNYEEFSRSPEAVHLHGPGLLRPVLGHRGPPTPQTIRGPIHVFDHASRSSRARGSSPRRSDTHSQALHGAPRVSDGDLERQGTNFVGRTTSCEERRAGVRRGSIRAPGPLAIHTPAHHSWGAWERMVQSVKRALTTVLQEQHPREEVLSTLLAEAEFTVNSRPLTHVSVSAEDPEALTRTTFCWAARRGYQHRARSSRPISTVDSSGVASG